MDNHRTNESKLLNSDLIIPKPIEGKIRILRIINRFNIGGPTYNATFLTKYIGEEYQTLLVGGLPEKNEADSLYILEKYGVQPLLLKEMQREPNSKTDREAYKKLKLIIKEFKPHIVHTHASKAGALGRRAAKKCGVPVIVHTFHGHVFHSYFGKVKTEVFRQIEKYLAKNTDQIIAISELQKRELIDVFRIANESKFKVVNLGFDLQQFKDKRSDFRVSKRIELGLEEGDIAIAIVGRLAPIKDHAFFLSAIDRLLSKTTKVVRVFVVGDGEMNEPVVDKINEINSIYGKEQIFFRSWERDVAEFNSAMDILCLTSKNEGTPVSLIEAQAGSLPVVTTDVGGVRDVIKDELTGIIAKERTVDCFANSLLELVENEKKREFMSQNGWNHVEEKFSYQTLVQNMNVLYKDILKEKKVKWQE